MANKMKPKTDLEWKKLNHCVWSRLKDASLLKLMRTATTIKPEKPETRLTTDYSTSVLEWTAVEQVRNCRSTTPCTVFWVVEMLSEDVFHQEWACLAVTERSQSSEWFRWPAVVRALFWGHIVFIFVPAAMDSSPASSAISHQPARVSLCQRHSLPLSVWSVRI